MDYQDDDRGFGHATALATIQGEKSSGGKTGGSANVAKDTLFTNATLRILDLLGEGECVGPVGGLQGVYLNDVPVQNPDGSFNTKGIAFTYRPGTPDQPHIEGFPGVETPNTTFNATKVIQQQPITASVNGPDTNRVRVTLQIPALYVAKNDGSVTDNQVSYRIQARYQGGPWINALGDQTIAGKNSSPQYPSHEIALPMNPAGVSSPWFVQVVRLSPDENNEEANAKYTRQSDIIFQSITEIIDAKFTYPHSAYYGMVADVSLFGGSAPRRQVLMDGKYISIPSNYDPAARTYTGIWDGTFKEGYSNNPAWVFYDILENDRFGLGEFIDVDAIDKWSLYQIGGYCDQLVADGAGGREPRFTFNAQITEQREAFELLQLIAQVFRGMVYWSSGTVTATQDRPSDPVILASESNVIDGEFNYTSSGRKARHTVAIVAYNDPNDLYRVNYEVVEDQEGIARYGYNPTKVDLLGCTSRGQAHRHGLWRLLTELQETQVVTYRAGLDHAVVRPGDVVAVQDPSISNLDYSGRLLEGSTTTRLVLDRPVQFVAGKAYRVSVMLPNGDVFDTISENPGIEADEIAIGQLPVAPDKGAVWVLSSDIKAQLFRVLSAKEVEPHIYEIQALQHQPGKYATVDDGAPFVELEVSQFPKIVLAPTNLGVIPSNYFELGVAKQALTLSWTPGQPFGTVGYFVTAIKPDGALINLPRRASTSADFTDASIGTWTFFVTAVGISGATSDAVRYDYELLGFNGETAPRVVDLQVKGGGAVFVGRSATLVWGHSFPDGRDPYPLADSVYVYDQVSNALLHRESLPIGQTEWTYDYQVNLNEGGPRRAFRVAVAAQLPGGGEGNQTALLVSNPAPAVVALSLESANGIIVASYVRPDDKDLEGGLFWQSETSGFNPLTTPPVYDGPNPTAILTGDEGKRYYVRVAAYDAFSKDPAQLNISAEQSIVMRISLIDVVAPEIPAAPTFGTPTIVKDANGRLSVTVTATWPASTSGNFGSYSSRARLNSDKEADWVYYELGSTASQTFTGLPLNSTLQLQVRAHNESDFARSGYSPTGSITTPASTTPPGPITNLTATGSFQNAFVRWDNPTDSDLSYIEVYASVDNNIANATRVARVAAPGNTWQDNTLSATGSRYYWARPFNTSKLGALTTTGPAQATSAAITAAQIAASAIADSLYVRGIEPLPVVTALPTVSGYTGPGTVAFNGRQYSLRNGAWTLAWAGANAQDVIGKLVAGQLDVDSVSTAVLRAGAIKADMLDARIITADKLAIGLNTGNQIWNSDFGVEGWVGATANDAAGPLFTAYDTNWVVAGTKGFYIRVPGNDVGKSPYFEFNFPTGRVATAQLPNDDRTNYLPVLGGKTYEFSGYLSCHRMTGRLVLYYLNNAKQVVAQADSNSILANYASGVASDSWRARLILKAPTTATSAILRMVGTTTGEGGVNLSYVFISAPYFGLVPDGTPERTGADAVKGSYSDYAPQSRTIISGGQVALNTLTAGAIVAGSMTTDRFTAGSIDAKIMNVDTLAVQMLNAKYIKSEGLFVGSKDGESLNSIINGTASVKIEGGAISANSIDVTRLKVGSRGISTVDLEFQIERDSKGALTNVVTWTNGYILYTDSAGVQQSPRVAAGRKAIDGGYWYIWWDMTVPTQLNCAKDNWPAIKGDRNTVLMAAISATTGLAVFYGGTVIDGTKITTLSITANQIAANTITADKIQAYTVFAQTVYVGGKTRTTDKAYAGTITLEGSTGRIYVNNHNDNWTQVIIGNVSPWLGDTIGKDSAGQNVTVPRYGMVVYNEQRQMIFSTGGVTKEALLGFTGTGNVLFNTDFGMNDGNKNTGGIKSVLGWTPGGNNGCVEFGLRTDGYGLVDSAGTLILNATNGTGDGTIFGDIVARNSKGGRWPASPGQRWEASAYVNTHRSNMEIYIGFYNSAGAAVAYQTSGQTGQTDAAGGYISNYRRIGVFATAPDGTEFVDMFVRNMSIWQGNPVLFMCKPYLGQCPPNQTELSPYTPGADALSIDASNISTYIQGAIIDTAYIKDAAISNAKILNGAITNAKITNLEVDSAKIANLTVGNSKIADSAVTSWVSADSNTDGKSSVRDNYCVIRARSASSKFLITVWMKGAAGSTQLASQGSTPGSLKVNVQYSGLALSPISDVTVPFTQVYLPSNGGNHWFTPAFSYSFIWAPTGGAVDYGFQVDNNSSSLQNFGIGIFVMELSK